ncbi:MAG: peptidoglycan synthetase [Chlorobi bacterium]|nr:peptidoglycan synthetase [Chlorobiota bacterium]
MKIHFIAIGGSAMHNLAIALKQNGDEVSGSDDEIFEPSRSRLAKHGLLPEKEGWHPEKITNRLDAVILGMHARADNPELLKAQKLGLKIFSYPEFLYHHSRNKKRVVIGGSHGKTTITGMVMHVLKSVGMDFDYMVGSKLKDFDVMVRLSDKAPVMIFEGDEYLTSPIDRRPKFHWYRPHLALLTGIAWDHINVFPTFENYVDQFREFIGLIENEGTLVFCSEDHLLKKLALDSRGDIKKVSYSFPGYFVRDGVTHIETSGGAVSLKVFGKHNLMNINGARLLCNEMGINDHEFYQAISAFEGAANRLELVRQNGENRLYKDFAHAPSKVRATIQAVREQFPVHRLVACLELHTFSSLSKEFLGEYRGSFEGVDEGCVFFSPHAVNMKRLPELHAEDVREGFGNEKIAIFDDSKRMTGWLHEQKQPGTVFLMMSSGNFDGIDWKELSNQLV